MSKTKHNNKTRKQSKQSEPQEPGPHEKVSGAAARSACAEKFLNAAPAVADAICTLAIKQKKEWAMKYVMTAVRPDDAVEKQLADELENEQQEAFISTGFERRLIEDLRRSGGIPEGSDENAG